LHREEAADGPPLCVFKLLLSLTATRDDMKGRAMRCGSEQREKSISMMEQWRFSARVQGDFHPLDTQVGRRSGSTLLHRPKRRIL
jgi:hypothetical protein